MVERLTCNQEVTGSIPVAGSSLLERHIMITWHKVSKKLPDDNQICWITSTKGLSCSMIVGPIVYKKDAKGWLDLFATREAGSIYETDVVTHWTEEENINAPEDEEE